MNHVRFTKNKYFRTLKLSQSKPLSGSNHLDLYVVTASIRNLDNLAPLLKNLNCGNMKDCALHVIVIDEIDGLVRKHNRKIMSAFGDTRFFGRAERSQWFKSRFCSGFEKYETVIPERCHAETSFGFMVAYEEGADVIIELDDDVASHNEYHIGEHLGNLFNDNGVTMSTSGKWYNTLENLGFDDGLRLFPRGHPYAKDCRKTDYAWSSKSSRCVLNMGLWSGDLDLDAVTLVYHSGLEGKCQIPSQGLRKRKVIVGGGSYFALCSMNTAFQSKLVPAFYQLYMNQFGVDRFDDIWSGIFLKKIVDYMNEKMCIGAPLVTHIKAPRDSFSDLKKEIDGMSLNERLWRIVDDISLSGSTYLDAYISLIQGLKTKIARLSEITAQKDFIELQLEKMSTWTSLMDSLT